MGPGGRTFGRDDVELAEDLAARAALAMDNVRLYQQERTVAETLQRSLLPELPEIPNLETAAHYVSASTAADVGGDFYDLLRPPRRLGGHRRRRRRRPRRRRRGGDGSPAGRPARRRLGRRGPPTRAVALARVDRLVQGLQVASLATHRLRPGRAAGDAGCALAGARRQRRAPADAAADPYGAVRLVDGATGLLVGRRRPRPPGDDRPRRPGGSTLVAYTDGLIERPGRDMDQGIHELCERSAAAPRRRAAAGALRRRRQRRARPPRRRRADRRPLRLKRSGPAAGCEQPVGTRGGRAAAGGPGRRRGRARGATASVWSPPSYSAHSSPSIHATTSSSTGEPCALGRPAHAGELVGARAREVLRDGVLPLGQHVDAEPADRRAGAARCATSGRGRRPPAADRATAS